MEIIVGLELIQLLRKNVVIGDGYIIGAESVVTKDIPPMLIAVGTPAKVIGQRIVTNEAQGIF